MNFVCDKVLLFNEEISMMLNALFAQIQQLFQKRYKKKHKTVMTDRIFVHEKALFEMDQLADGQQRVKLS